MKKIFFILIALGFLSCSRSQNICVNFDLNHPTEVIKLPSVLKEISGITMFGKNKIACVQDEKGTVYVYDIHKDKLKESVDFGRNKDYEAIANVNDTIYVLKSNGTIYEIDALESTEEQTTEYATFLSKENNCEGLCYDKLNNRLLIACKGKPEKGTAKKSMKAVYAFDLSKKELQKEPVLIFSPEDIIEMGSHSEQNKTFLNSFSEEQKHSDLFEPSEIAIEPLSGNYFILSSVGKRLAAFSPAGKLIAVVNLDPSLFKQPEGLTFTPKGEMIISDEGKGGKGNLVILAPVK